MRRTGFLFDSVIEPNNLKLAWLKARRGKTSNPVVQGYFRNLEANLRELRESILDGTPPIGSYEYFTIQDPKERLICAASLPQRILHHALMNVLHPIFERFQIADSYACRVGKGTQSAVLRAFHGAKGNLYFLKMDVRKYFDSIDHEVLKTKIARLIKDARVTSLLFAIIDSYQTQSGKGIPIGNLTSQYFANHYLASIDHQAKEHWNCKTWIRYMDDIVVCSDSHGFLNDVYGKTETECSESLGLNLKPEISDSTCMGIPFLGFLIKNSGIFLSRRSKSRFSAKSKEIEWMLGSGKITERTAAERATSMCAYTLIAHSRGFRYHVYHGRDLGRRQ